MIQITNMKMKEIAKIYGLENCNYLSTYIHIYIGRYYFCSLVHSGDHMGLSYIYSKKRKTYSWKVYRICSKIFSWSI